MERNPQGTQKYLDSAFATIKSPTVNDRFRYYSFHFLLAGKYGHDYKKSLMYADSMLTLINNNGGIQKYPSNYAEANFAVGDAYFDLRRYNESYQYDFEGYQAGKSYLNGYALANYTYRMGMITYKQSHYNLAANYFKESYKHALPLDTQFVNFYRNQEVLDNVALCYSHLGVTDSALAYFNKTLNYIDDKGDRFPARAKMMEVARAVIYGNQADIYIRNKQYEQARELLKKSIAINLLPGNDNSDAILAEIKLAKIYADEDKDILLTDLLDNIHGQLSAVNNKTAEADWNMLMSGLSAKHGNLKDALHYNQRYTFLKDSLAAITKTLQESNVSEQLNNFEKEHEIESLTNNNKLQQIYLIVAMILTVMAMIIISLIYRNWRRSKKDLETVNRLNSQISEQKQSLEQTLEQLNYSSQEKDRIMHTVVHDLRNPLGGIASLASVMLTDDEFSDEQKEYVTIIKESADNSLELINEIFEATNTVLDEHKMQWVDVNTLLNNSIELLSFKAAEKNQQITFRPLLKPEQLLISREKIWRVISNLIINAIKFSPIGSVIDVDVISREKDIWIKVKDNGIGISDDMKPKIFNMFTEAKRPGTMGEKSFGLGLSICRQIIEKHGGRIWFDSEPGKGTTFFVSLNKS